MTCPAAFKHRVTIQSEAAVMDGQGGRSTAWSDVATVWASVEPVTGKEFYAWGRVLGESTYLVRMRYRPGIRPKMRLRYGARSFDINSVIDEHEEHRFLVLGCTERV